MAVTAARKICFRYANLFKQIRITPRATVTILGASVFNRVNQTGRYKNYSSMRGNIDQNCIVNMDKQPGVEKLLRESEANEVSIRQSYIK